MRSSKSKAFQIWPIHSRNNSRHWIRFWLKNDIVPHISIICSWNLQAIQVIKRILLNSKSIFRVHSIQISLTNLLAYIAQCIMFHLNQLNVIQLTVNLILWRAHYHNLRLVTCCQRTALMQSLARESHCFQFITRLMKASFISSPSICSITSEEWWTPLKGSKWWNVTVWPLIIESFLVIKVDTLIEERLKVVKVLLISQLIYMISILSETWQFDVIDGLSWYLNIYVAILNSEHNRVSIA